MLVPCGGGGLISGTAIALAELSPATAIVAVEPQGFDDTLRSLAAGRRLSVAPGAPGAKSICDALLAPMPGALTFAINSRLLSGAVAVSDQDVRHAMAAAFRHFKLVVEPGGAVALAAALAGAYPCRGRTVAVVCSGGNVDAETYRGAIME